MFSESGSLLLTLAKHDKLAGSPKVPPVFTSQVLRLHAFATTDWLFNLGSWGEIQAIVHIRHFSD